MIYIKYKLNLDQIGPKWFSLLRLCQRTYRYLIDFIGAGEGNRTLVVSLGSFCSTIELHPRRAKRPSGAADDVGASSGHGGGL